MRFLSLACLCAALLFTTAAGAQHTYDEVGAVPPRHQGLADRPVTPPPLRAALTVAGSWHAYAGDWFRGFHPGLGLQGTARFGLGRRSWITAEYRRQSAGTDEDVFYSYEVNRDITVEHGQRAEVLGLMFGHRLNPGSSSRGIVALEIGLVAIRRTWFADSAELGSADDSDGTLGVALRLGGLVPLGRSLALDAGLNLVHKPAPFSDDYGGTILGLHLGAGWVGW